MPDCDNVAEEAKIFHEGIKLFNDGEWFEAHEKWEDIWRSAAGAKKKFYQGLIQGAVTLEHIRRGNPRGVRSVWKTCVPKFDGLPEVYMGVDIPQFLVDLAKHVDPVLDLPSTYFDPDRPHGQQLPFDPTATPSIELESDPFAAGKRCQAPFPK